MKNDRALRVLLLSMLLLVSHARGEYSFFDITGDNAGHTVCNFLTLPVGAQQLAVGQPSGMISWDATDLFTAPSHSAFFKQYYVSLSHLEWVMQLRKEYLAACMPILDVGTVGFYSQVFTLGRFEYARDIDEQVSEPKAAEFNFGLSYARQIIPDKLGLGITIGYIESRLAGEAGRAFSFGLDATGKPKRWATVHGFARNLGTRVTYNDLSEPQPTQAGVSAQFTPFTHDDTVSRRKIGLTVGLGALKTADYPIQFGAGLEFKPLPQVSIRGGYEYDYGDQPSAAGAGFGAGLVVNGYGGDVGFKYQSPEFGWVWSASVKMGAEEIVQRSAMDYYKIAEKHFRKERYRLCVEFAKRALNLNPNLWQAHELISRTITLQRREKGREIVLVYTGNSRGQFVPLQVGGGTIGGLARQATVVRELQKRFAIGLAIDAGNMIEANTHILRARFADTYYDKVKFDAVGLGPGEFDFGFRRYRKEVKKSGMAFVCTNAKGRPGPGIVSDHTVRAGRYEFCILSVIAPSVPRRQQASAKALGPIVSAVQNKLKSASVRNADIRVLILHDRWQQIKTYAQDLEGIDIVICGSVGQRFEVPMKIGNTIFLSTGVHSRYVGALALRFDRKKNLLSYNNKLYPLTDQVASDPEIEEELKRIAVKISLTEQGLGEQAIQRTSTDGVFPFVSNRHGAPNIYLKVMKQLGEFPLTFTPTESQRPRISFLGGKLVYLEHDKNEGITKLNIMDLTGAGKLELDVGGSVVDATISPSGTWVYASVETDTTGATDILRIRANGGEATPVVAWEDGSERDVTFSPSAKNMAFTSNRDGRWQLYVADSVGGTPVRFSDPNADHIKPQFSPDGNYIAYLSDRRNFGGKMDLWVHDMATGQSAQVTINTKVEEFCWLNDNKRLVYANEDSSSVQLYAVDIFTKITQPFIPADSTKGYSEHTPRLLQAEDDSRILYVREYPDGDKQIYWVKTDGAGDLRIVNGAKEDWLE